jgi:hypothetical protein
MPQMPTHEQLRAEFDAAVYRLTKPLRQLRTPN